MSASDSANSILLTLDASGFREVITPDGKRGLTRDASFLGFIVEDLLSHCATGLAIAPSSPFYDSTAILPRSLRSYVSVVDKHSEAIEKVAAIMEPVYQSLGFEFNGFGATVTPPGCDDAVAYDLVVLAVDLHRFLIGLDHRVQVDVQPRETLKRAQRLRKLSRNPDARAHLASIEGIFRSYSKFDVPSLSFRSDAREDHIEHFARLVEDETYRSIAKQAGLLGVPTRMTHALIQLRRLARDFFARQGVSDGLELGGLPLQAATSVPVPTAGTVARVLGKPRYLPPLIALGAAQDRATREWHRVKPPLILTPHISSELLGDAVAADASEDQIDRG